LFDEPIERCNAIVGFTAAEDSGVMRLEGSEIGPGAATKVLVLLAPAAMRGSRRDLGITAKT
jgi:hypothetical protein